VPVVRIWRSALKNAYLCNNASWTAGERLEIPSKCNLLYSNVLMATALRDMIKKFPHGIVTVSNGLRGIVAVM
jgi:hypothetical protein